MPLPYENSASGERAPERNVVTVPLPQRRQVGVDVCLGIGVRLSPRGQIFGEGPAADVGVHLDIPVRSGPRDRVVRLSAVMKVPTAR